MPDTVATTVASSPDADKILPPQGITPENSPGVTVSATMPAALASWGADDYLAGMFFRLFGVRVGGFAVAVARVARGQQQRGKRACK